VTRTRTPQVPAPAASVARVAAALLTVYVVWGSTYLGIRVVVTNGLPPLMSMGARFVAGGAILLAVLAARRGVAALAVDRAQLVASGVVGLLLLLGGNGLVSVAETTVPSGLAALLVATTPLWMVVLGVFLRRRTRAATWAGTLVGLAGTAILARPGSQGEVQWWGIGLILVATCSWALGSLLSGRLQMPPDPFVGASYQMLLGGSAMIVAGAVLGEGRGLDLGRVTADGWLALGYLTVFGSLLAYTAYYWLLGNAPLQLVSTYAYVNPVVAVLLGWLLLDEEVTSAVLLGGAVALLGVVVVVSSERRREPEPAGAQAAPVAVAAEEADPAR
jgi:drug/metabolite transporter (DMT)-like permease